jgi:hypothetical protein
LAPVGVIHPGSVQVQKNLPQLWSKRGVQVFPGLPKELQGSPALHVWSHFVQLSPSGAVL